VETISYVRTTVTRKPRASNGASLKAMNYSG